MSTCLFHASVPVSVINVNKWMMIQMIRLGMMGQCRLRKCYPSLIWWILALPRLDPTSSWLSMIGHLILPRTLHGWVWCRIFQKYLRHRRASWWHQLSQPLVYVGVTRPYLSNLRSRQLHKYDILQLGSCKSKLRLCMDS